ncbi:unnamed protein product [Caretta caretta]
MDSGAARAWRDGQWGAPAPLGTWDQPEGPTTDSRALISTRPEVPSGENVAKGRERVAALGGLSRPVEEGLDPALLAFRREAGCLRENARLAIRGEGQQLTFLSGQGGSTLQVPYVRGAPCY